MNATHWIARMQLLGARAESAAKASAMSPTGRAPGCCLAVCAGAEVWPAGDYGYRSGMPRVRDGSLAQRERERKICRVRRSDQRCWLSTMIATRCAGESGGAVARKRWTSRSDAAPSTRACRLVRVLVRRRWCTRTRARRRRGARVSEDLAYLDAARIRVSECRRLNCLRRGRVGGRSGSRSGNRLAVHRRDSPPLPCA